MEARRSARIASTFWVAIAGVDAEPRQCYGDISGTGVYFETDADVGHPGTVQYLQVATDTRDRSVGVMAYVVRRITLEDVHGAATGVAFAFMPESGPATDKLLSFVKHVIVKRNAGDPSIEMPNMSTRAATHVAGAEATLQALTVSSLTLETSWAVQEGEELRVDIMPPGANKPLRLSGRADKIIALTAVNAAAEPRYQIQLSIENERVPQTMREGELSRTLDQLFSSLIAPNANGKRTLEPARELYGLLARVHMSTLCSLFELEKMSGRLLLQKRGDSATVFIRDGQIVDVDVTDGRSPRARMRDLFGWDEGAFEFFAEPVDRPDTVHMSTTALLLDLAREEDEERHSSSTP